MANTFVSNNSNILGKPQINLSLENRKRNIERTKKFMEKLNKKE